ncbi:phage/plasmid primase, P4 family [Phenylobacterium sp.]|uniref:DNA primase family protein n=1 Tax=Phenylobacterium sp. TaxID=1871053 RepID=UPI00391A4C0C
MSADGSFAYSSTPSPEELARFDLNDFGNALRLIRLVGGDVDEETNEVSLDAATLLYLRENGWIGWNGRHWDLKMGQRLAERTAHKVAQGLVAQRAHLQAKYDKKLVDTFIRSAGNAGAISAMLKVAESYLQVDLEAFDADPLMVTVRNCTLRFHREAGDGLRVERRRHDPRDRITRMAQVDYDPAASAPLWDAKLAFWQPDPAMAGYLQRSAGYALTGHTHEQAFFIFQGKGRDGKSTFMNVLRELMGDYGDVADVRTFLDTGTRGGADASPDLARLAGDCRLVSVAEPPRGAKLNEAMIKSFTGGAPIVARRLRQDLFSFTPKPKVFMEANSRPVIRGDDEGIWRRIRLVLWEHQLKKEEADPTLPAKLRAEYPGILNWIIQGVGDWLSEGLAEPERVSAAMDDYRKGSSPFGEWFVERVELVEGVKTPAAWFYSDYKDWAEAQGIEKPMSQRAFGDALADRQIIRCGKDSKGAVLRLGARLRPRGAALDGVAGAGGGSGESPFDVDGYEGFDTGADRGGDGQ